MSKKDKTVFVCQQCGYEAPRWQGQCICGAWNSMVEEKVLSGVKEDTRRRIGGGGKPQLIRDIKESKDNPRMNTGIPELNRVLGGGLVKGSLTLISGEPGIGKSTIIMQAAVHIGRKYGEVLYVSGEESEEQIKLRAERIFGEVKENLYILSETNLENVEQVIEDLKPKFVIIDSIQTMYSQKIDSAPGSVSQVRVCGNDLMRMGKVGNIPIFIVAHVTKNGELAGPKIVEHLVDSVLHFTGERDGELRILRAYKNRFGTTSEIGAFEMTGKGLMQIEDLSKRFLEESEIEVPGSMVTAVYEGTRPLLLEVQGLTATTNLGFPRRTAIGIDLSRLNMIIAVLEKKGKLSLVNQDVYVNVVGGLKPQGTSMDLAVALALHSATRNKVVLKGTLAIGEIGLTGDLRPIGNVEKIVSEADRMGYKKIILPKNQGRKLKNRESGIVVIGVANLVEALEAYWK